jgi:hypothetical protein
VRENLSDSWQMTNVTHKFLSMYLFLFLTLYMFRVHRAHHQERQIVLIQPLVTVTLCWCPCRVQMHDARPTKCKILSNRATIKCQVSIWLVTRGLRMTAFLYACHPTYTDGTWASRVFSMPLNHAVLREIFYIIFDCVFCRVSLCSICRHTRRLCAKTNGSV